MVWSSGWGGWFIYFFIIFSFFHVFSHTLHKSSFPNKYKLSFYSYHMCKWHLPPSSVIIRLPLTRGLCLKQKHYAQYLQKTPFLVYLQIKFFFFFFSNCWLSPSLPTSLFSTSSVRISYWLKFEIPVCMISPAVHAGLYHFPNSQCLNGEL